MQSANLEVEEGKIKGLDSADTWVGLQLSYQRNKAFEKEQTKSSVLSPGISPDRRSFKGWAMPWRSQRGKRSCPNTSAAARALGTLGHSTALCSGPWDPQAGQAPWVRLMPTPRGRSRCSCALSHGIALSRQRCIWVSATSRALVWEMTNCCLHFGSPAPASALPDTHWCSGRWRRPSRQSSLSGLLWLQRQRCVKKICM